MSTPPSPPLRHQTSFGWVDYVCVGVCDDFFDSHPALQRWRVAIVLYLLISVVVTIFLLIENLRRHFSRHTLTEVAPEASKPAKSSPKAPRQKTAEHVAPPPPPAREHEIIDKDAAVPARETQRKRRQVAVEAEEAVVARPKRAGRGMVAYVQLMLLWAHETHIFYSTAHILTHFAAYLEPQQQRQRRRNQSLARAPPAAEGTRLPPPCARGLPTLATCVFP